MASRENAHHNCRPARLSFEEIHFYCFRYYEKKKKEIIMIKQRGHRPNPVWLIVLIGITLVGGDVRNNEVVDSQNRVKLKSDQSLSTFEVTEDWVYVGGTNVLYQLNAKDLVVESLVRTGPELDSVKCPPTGCDRSTNASRTLTDNHNKVLVVDAENEKLIVCGSIRQGSCYKYELRNISSPDVEFHPKAVAANDAKSSTFAFIGPQRYHRWGQGNVLYVGTTYTSNGVYQHDVPAISSRNLVDLNYAVATVSKQVSSRISKRANHTSLPRFISIFQSTLRIDVKYRDRFLVKYVYGFNSSSHVYFVTVQPKVHLPGHEEQGYVTRIARVCVTDGNFDTYTEITLQCGDDHNIVQDAYLATSKKSNIHTVQNDSFLVTSFGKSSGSSNQALNTSSAVCIYSLADIDRRFDENIHNCFNGSMRHRNMEYISGTISEGKCPDRNVGNILNFCEVGLKISGPVPLAANPILTTNHEAFTSLYYSDIDHQSTGVLVLGTSLGTVKTYVYDSKLRLLSTQTLSAPNAVTKVYLKDLSIIALQRHTLTKLPVAECQQYTQCGACVAAANPFCGWCSMENTCSSRNHCQAIWVAYGDESQCSQIEQVIPSSLSLPTAVSHITLIISALPAQNKFNCVFGHNVTAVRARQVSGGLQCAIPSSEAFSSYQVIIFTVYSYKRMAK